MDSPWALAVVLVLVIACWALWYGARAVRRGRSAPAWAGAIDKHRALAVGLLGLAVGTLVALGLLVVWGALSA
jgi:hypothetical protein